MLRISILGLLIKSLNDRDPFFFFFLGFFFFNLYLVSCTVEYSITHCMFIILFLLYSENNFREKKRSNRSIYRNVYLNKLLNKVSTMLKDPFCIIIFWINLSLNLLKQPTLNVQTFADRNFGGWSHLRILFI